MPTKPIVIGCPIVLVVGGDMVVLCIGAWLWWHDGDMVALVGWSVVVL
jgi:hypothetical protein